MKGVYLCSRKHRIAGYDIDYNDIEDFPGITLKCDALLVDLAKYDYIIATPPCNYYSRANYRRETSVVAQSTKHLLPRILERCIALKVPFLIENVCNYSLLPCGNVYEFDFHNHHYYSNVLFLVPSESWFPKQNKQNVCRNKRDGNPSVDYVIRCFLSVVVQ